MLSLYDVASPLAHLLQGGVRMASIYFCLLVLVELPLPSKKICKVFFSTCPLHLQHDSTRWCQELSCSCNESEAFTCFVPQWEDASSLACRLFRNCFPKGPFPRFASKSRKRFMKWKDITETSWHEGREGKIVFCTVRRIFTGCTIHRLFCGISFIPIFPLFPIFSLNSILFSERKANARTSKNDAQWALLWTAPCALQAWPEAASHKAALSSS